MGAQGLGAIRPLRVGVRKPYESFPVRPLAAFKQDQTEWRPVLNVRLGRKHAQAGPWFKAIVDTGSQFCLFRADLGAMLGIDVRSGTADDICGVVGGSGEPAYFHRINLYIEHDWIVEVDVGFVFGLGSSRQLCTAAP